MRILSNRDVKKDFTVILPETENFGKKNNVESRIFSNCINTLLDKCSVYFAERLLFSVKFSQKLKAWKFILRAKVLNFITHFHTNSKRREKLLYVGNDICSLYGETILVQNHPQRYRDLVKWKFYLFFHNRTSIGTKFTKGKCQLRFERNCIILSKINVKIQLGAICSDISCFFLLKLCFNGLCHWKFEW